MYQFIKKMVEAAEITAIVCDICGHGIKITNNVPEEDFLNISKPWSETSIFPDEHHTWHMCQNCYKKIVDEYNPKIEVGKITTKTIS